MPSPLTPKQWIIIVLVNVVVSAVTTLMIVRVLTNQPAARASIAITATVAGQAPVANVPPTAAPLATSAQSANAPTAAPALTSTPAPKPTLPPIPSETPAKTSATATAPATSSTGAPSVHISAVLYPGQRQREVVVIVNEGNEVSLKGWTLGSSKNISYTFSNVTLFKDSFINLHTTNGADVPTDLFWNRPDPAWQTGDVLTLANQGTMIATFTVK